MNKTILLILLLLCPVTILNAYEVPITVQESIVIPGSGIDRTNEIVTVGVPLPKEWNVQSTNTLGLTNTPAAQFRVLKTHDNGAIAWVLIDALATVPANGTATMVLNTTGAGNFDNVKLAEETTDTIKIYTGVGYYTIRKPDFALFDAVTINNVQVAGSCRGVYAVDMNGIEYRSTWGINDVIIEENGPVKAVVRARGRLYNADKTAWICDYTVRLFFYRMSNNVTAQLTIRNASKDKVAHIGIKEAGVGVWVPTIERVKISTHAGENEQTVAGEDIVSYYQAVSTWQTDWSGGDMREWVHTLKVPYYGVWLDGSWAQTGYRLTKNGDTVIAGPDNVTAAYLDARNPVGSGVTVGFHWMKNEWGKSIRTDVDNVIACVYPPEMDQDRARKNGSIDTTRFWLRWGSYDTSTLLFSFHAVGSNPADEMKKSQHHLIAKAPVSHYNACTTGIDPLYPMIPRSFESAYCTERGWTPRAATVNRYVNPAAHLLWDWGESAGGNQHDYARIHLTEWLMVDNNLINAAKYYHRAMLRFAYNSTRSIFYSDDYDFSQARYGSSVNPLLAANTGQADMKDETGEAEAWYVHTDCFFEPEHQHWYGIPLAYYLTGEERFREAVDEWLEQFKRWQTVNEPGRTCFLQTNVLRPVRIFSWSLYGHLAAYKWTKDPSWLDNAELLFNKLWGSTRTDWPTNEVDMFINWQGHESFPDFTNQGFVGGGNQSGWYGGVCANTAICTFPGVKTFYIKYLLYGALLNYYFTIADDHEDKADAKAVLSLMSNAMLKMGGGQETPWRYWNWYGYRLDQPENSYTNYMTGEWAQYPLAMGLKWGLNNSAFFDMATKNIRYGISNTGFSVADSQVEYPPFPVLLYEMQRFDGPVVHPPFNLQLNWR